MTLAPSAMPIGPSFSSHLLFRSRPVKSRIAGRDGVRAGPPSADGGNGCLMGVRSETWAGRAKSSFLAAGGRRTVWGLGRAGAARGTGGGGASGGGGFGGLGRGGGLTG